MKYMIFMGLLVIIVIEGCIFTPPQKIESTAIEVDENPKRVESPVDEVDPKKDVITFAKSQLGVPYRHGGIDSYGFDCSGFVYFVHKEALNRKIPRTSKDQSKYGYKINKNELQQGDLVFFDTSSKGRINHSGIYIGAGKFIHSSSGKRRGVVISPLDSGFYQRNYKWARRIDN